MKLALLASLSLIPTVQAAPAERIVVEKGFIRFAGEKKVPLGTTKPSPGLKVIRRATMLGSDHVARISTTLRFPGPPQENAEATEITSSVEIYNTAGDAVFKRSLSRGRSIASLRASKNLSFVSVVSGCEIECGDAVGPWRIEVWDSKGRPVIEYPEKADSSCKVSPQGHWISASGAYAFTSCSSGPGSILLDVRSKRKSSPLFSDIGGEVDEHHVRLPDGNSVDFRRQDWTPL